MKRSAGILLPIFSLPSNYGIGTFGKEAYRFVDFLDKAGQTYWQILPLGPTSFGDSPYQAFSSFAGNPYFIDFDLLVEEGLLEQNDLTDYLNSKTIDYEYQYNYRYLILKKAFLRGKDNPEVNTFIEENKEWLKDYALFMACKKHFNGKAWLQWDDEDIKLRKSEALFKYEQLLKEDIEFNCFVQYLFFKQYNQLKTYANSKGVQIIGDIPIYVPLDSCEVWANKENFALDDNCNPIEVSGVPGDYFNADGQLWGNPLYDYDYQAKDNYRWWIKRIEAATKLYDALRIDHFRGFESFWAVKYGAQTAREGRWIKGPGMDLLSVVKEHFASYQFISEDLGLQTPEVRQLLSDFGYPGMKVLEFAFDSDSTSEHLPHNYHENCLCYVGTHDNCPIMGYVNTQPKETIEYAKKYIGYNEADGFNFSMIRCGMASIAKVFIGQMQDYLGLDESSRINTPGSMGCNWTFRLEKDCYDESLALRIREYTAIYGRLK